MNFTVSIFAKPVIAERRHVEFCCTDFHTDNKEIQNLQTEILYAMKPSMAVSAQILTKIVLNIQLFKRSHILKFTKNSKTVQSLTLRYKWTWSPYKVWFSFLTS